jgi:hypothetical protein
MIKIFYAVAVSAIAAGCFVAFPTLSQQVHATPPTQATVQVPVQALQSDRVEARTAAVACGQNAWPYIEAGCLRNSASGRVEERDVRLVSADRL